MVIRIEVAVVAVVVMVVMVAVVAVVAMVAVVAVRRNRALQMNKPQPLYMQNEQWN